MGFTKRRRMCSWTKFEYPEVIGMICRSKWLKEGMDNTNPSTEGEKPESQVTRRDWMKHFRPYQVDILNSEEGSRSSQNNTTSVWVRRIQTVKILSVSIISVPGLLTFVSIDTHRALETIRKEYKERYKTLHDIVKLYRIMPPIRHPASCRVETSILLAKLIHSLQIERGATVLCISSPNSSSVGNDLLKARLNTDKNIKSIINWSEGQQSLQSREVFIRDVTDFRSRGEVGNCVFKMTIQDALNFYTGLIDTMIEWLIVTIKNNKGESTLLQLLGYRMFLIAKEKTGLERKMGGSYFSRGVYFIFCLEKGG
ncbi:predicted protein [Nematostella vectensis]|uniref:Nitrate/nitrite sensing protein domain-containing protein n=1 Tax=Nematostella vectensis TaxID=45351 RepID=A7SA19_NEMVE|nr:predicted protein [Nematostella vectensis]|eukprot:XP_001631547.1 predicted protein [Nematostella vectensis]